MSKPTPTLSDLLGGLGAEASQAVQAALIRAISLGESVASIAKTIMDTLGTSLFRALVVARNVLVGGFRNAFMGTGRASDAPIGWYWIANLGSACFPGGTMITTQRGEIPIEQITIGDMALTHEGRYRRVTNTMCRDYAGETVTLRLPNSRKITATSNHPFLIEREGKLDWIEASNIRLGDSVVCQSESSINEVNHSISERAVERCISDTYYSVPSTLQEQCLTGVSFSDAGFTMPVYAIHFQRNIERRQHEINRQGPASDHMLLRERYSQRFQTQARILFRLAFTSIAAIAASRTEAATYGLSRCSAKLLTTRQAGSDNRRAVTLFRAVFASFLALTKNLSTPFTGYKRPEIALVGRSTGSTVTSSLLMRVDFKKLIAFHAIDPIDFCLMPTYLRAELLLATLIINTKRVTTSLARLFNRGMSNSAFSRMRMLLLKQSIACSRAETSVASLGPSIGNSESSIALFANLFHIHSIPQIDTHIQKTGLVYNFEVEEDHSYVANGFVVHNCIACTLMSGSKHSMDEDMDSHYGCACTQEFFTAQDEQDSGDMQSGEDWFNEQDDSTQQDILGSARYDAWQSGVSLQSMVGVKHDPQWGKSIYIKPLKELQRR